MHTVFVYGTLRKGGSNHFRMSGSEFIGSARVRAKIYRIDTHPALIFPALKLGSDSWVLGEIYRVSEVQLRELDAYEGISERHQQPHEYRRVLAKVEMESGAETDAWVWEWNLPVDHMQPLPEGDWLLYEPNPT